MEYSKVENLRWVDAAHSGIEMDVTFEEIGKVPFFATPDDNAVAHERDLYQKALAGEFGPVAEYQEPVQTLDELKQELLQQLAIHKKQVEYGGIVVDGVRYETTKADQDRIAAAAVGVSAGLIKSFDFKAADKWITLSADQFMQVATAILGHVQACFSSERVHSEAIDKLKSVDAARAYDITTDWPKF